MVARIKLPNKTYYYRPRMAARLTVPLLGTREQRIKQGASTATITLEAVPKRVRIESNDHNHADTCEVTLDWYTAGVDPRMLDDAVVEVFVGQADEYGNWEGGNRLDCRFIGLMKECERSGGEDNPAEVRLSCVDYTTLFLEARPFGSEGIPDLNMTLDAAWERICSSLRVDPNDKTSKSRVEVLKNRLVFEGIKGIPNLGKAVTERFRKTGKVQTKPQTDAWAVWQQCVGMLGLVSYIRLDECVVTTATNYYSSKGATPVVIYGLNVDRWSESRVSVMAKRGVSMTSYDPLTQKTIEAFWPPIGDESVNRKRSTAKKAASSAEALVGEERDYFGWPGVQDQGTLLEIAKRVWEERSRQELAGTFSTHDMEIPTESGGVAEAMAIRAGEDIVVDVEPENRMLLSSLQSGTERINYLLSRGYTRGAARLIVANMSQFGELSCKFQVKRASTTLEVSEDSGEFTVEVEYCNRIEIDGSAKA